jgi:hypothetical protein
MDITETHPVLHTPEAKLDPFLDRLENRQKISISWAIDCTRPENNNPQPILKPENRLFTLPLAQTIV